MAGEAPLEPHTGDEASVEHHGLQRLPHGRRLPRGEEGLRALHPRGGSQDQGASETF